MADEKSENKAMQPQHAATAAASGMAAAVTTILVWVVQLGWHIAVPDNVAIAITAVLSGAAGFITHQWGAYFRALDSGRRPDA